MRFELRALLTLCIVALVCSCAKEGTESFSEKENLSFEAWMVKYAPDATKVEDGLFMEWITHGTGDSLAEDGDWVRINYTGRTLQNNVYDTRSENVAKLEGTYTPYTHYVPNFVYMSDPTGSYATMIEGQYKALLKMRQGDVVRVYMTSDKAYGSSGLAAKNVGYDGQYDLDGNKPIILDNLELVDMVATPIDDEAADVAEYALNNWGLTPADTLMDGFYFQTLTPITIKRDSISADSTIKVYYTGKFLDGFIFDTNIDSIQMRLYGEIKNEGPTEYKAADDSTSYITAWRTALSHMCYGDKIRMAFVSAYGYDIQGKSAQYNTSSSSSSASNLYNNYYNYLYYQNMYGYGGYGSSYYGNSYYNSYYNSMYYNQLYNSMYNSTSTDDEETTITITTEILPFTPLVFEMYVVPYTGIGNDITDSNTE